MPRDWLKNNQSLTTISTSAVPLHVRAFFKLTSFFSLWCQRCYTESWLLTKQATASSKVHTRTVIPRETLRTWGSKILLWICADQPPKLHETERTVTNTNAIAKSAENTSFCNSFSFLPFLYLSLNKNSFFNRIVVLFLFACHVSWYSKPFFPNTADVDFVLFSMNKIPTISLIKCYCDYW